MSGSGFIGTQITEKALEIDSAYTLRDILIELKKQTDQFVHITEEEAETIEGEQS